jgi:branched-chain amino acid transport system permease protein
MMNLRVAAFGKFKRLVVGYVGLALTSLVCAVGLAAAIEMIYHLQFEAGAGDTVRFLGFGLSTQSASHWLGSLAVFVVGLVMFELVRRRFALVWGGVQEEIEKELHRRGNA